jgi:hypothetical protein
MKRETMLKKFGLLVALIASLTGCGKENISTAEGSKVTPPLVGCYKEKTESQIMKVSISETGDYLIASSKDGEFKTKQTELKLFDTANKIETSMLSALKPSTDEDKAMIKEKASQIDALIQNNNGFMFMKFTDSTATKEGNKYSIGTYGIFIPMDKVECPK